MKAGKVNRVKNDKDVGNGLVTGNYVVQRYGYLRYDGLIVPLFLYGFLDFSAERRRVR